MNEKIENSFHGVIKEIPFICVDSFKDETKQYYFLSHMHTDHNQDLFFKKNLENFVQPKTIFMSEKTKIILSNTWGYYHLIDDIVRTPKEGEKVLIDDIKQLYVTLIEVDHMPGAVMFLFQYDNKNILYTGDFIIERDDNNLINMHEKLKGLHDGNGLPIPIDFTYIDETFNNISYADWPKRSDGEHALVEKAKEWLNENTENELHLHYRTPYAYDNILRKLHDEFKKPIRIDTETRNDLPYIYWKLYSASIVCSEESRIVIKDTKYANLIKRTRPGKRVLNIYISATRGCHYNPNNTTHRPLTKEEDDLYYLCYPTHCSVNQLNDFKNHFKCTSENTESFPKKNIDPPHHGMREQLPYHR